MFPYVSESCVHHTHTVDKPEVVIGYNGELIAGQKLVLTCSITFSGGLGNGIKIFPQWLRGEEGLNLKTHPPVDTHSFKSGPYIVNHTFDAPSTEDSDVYKCEVTVKSDHVGVLATASGSMSITILGTYGIPCTIVHVLH